MKKIFIVVFVISVFVETPHWGVSTAFASGTQTEGQGVRALGMGGAFIAVCDSPEAVFYNPAGLTQIKKAEAAFVLHSEMMKNMSEGVYLVGAEDGIIRYANPKFEEMFGYASGEMEGKHVSIVNAPTDKDPRETAREIMDVLSRKGEWHGEINNIKKDGTAFWCLANCSVFNHLEYGKVIVAVHTDITERKEAEEKIKDNEKELVKKMRDLEIFHRVAVGRELAMKELKARIAELEEKLSSKS